jgi:ATP-dependent exoDNAse (exonuclease V) alpha subunit
VEVAVDAVSLRLSAPRAAHQREGHERFTLDRILAEEALVMDLVDARDDRAVLWALDDRDPDTAALSTEQARAVRTIATSPWLVQPLSAPAGAGKTTSMRALRSIANNGGYGRVLVLAPTGTAVDVAMREGAGDTGLTIAKALQSLREDTLHLTRPTLVVVDEAAMVGTDDLRQLLTATTEAGVKTVLVGDAHQLAPVRARGGMFAQLCSDLPWTQHLTEVWRMNDPDERTASLALRDGQGAELRRAVDWYATQDRLACGDAITMAADALTAYQADTTAGRDALLVCDTTEMAGALNTRIHHQHLDRDAPTVTGMGGQRIGVGDLILSRRNDPTIDFHHSTPHAEMLPSVRNGNCWRVVGLDAQQNWLGAVRLEEGARVFFDGEYLREHVSLGYAVTVHSAQGVTADTCHAVLGEHASRALLYVAMTRGRHTNTAHLYQRVTGDHEYGHQESDGTHLKTRGDNQEAADLLRGTLANDQPAITAHDYAAHTLGEGYPTASAPSCSGVQQPPTAETRSTKPGTPKDKPPPASWSKPASSTPAENGTEAQITDSNSDRRARVRPRRSGQGFFPRPIAIPSATE